MVEVAERAPARTTWLAPASLLAGLLVVGAAARAFGDAGAAAVQNFFLVFGSLLIEAVPFVLLGALVAGAIEVFVPTSVFARLSSLPRPWQLPAAGLAGLAFPVCECGSVPVARRMAAKGLAPAAAVTFMLAAPVLNPVVIASTVVAYRGRESFWVMVGGRTALGLVVAMAVGWVVGRLTGADLLRAAPGAGPADPLTEMTANPHVHAGLDGGGRPAPDATPPTVFEQAVHGNEAPVTRYFSHVASDFVFMGRYLVAGAAVAGALQTFVPQSIVGSVAGTPVVDLLAMMGLAYLLALCSESDAFVAASFVQFGPSAQLAFLVFGPLLDTKLTFLYSGTFGRRFVAIVAAVVAAVTLAGTLWLSVVFG